MHMHSMPAMPATPGRMFVVGVLSVLAFLATPAAATPASTIVIYGAQSGTTLTLGTKGDKIVVKGNMAERHQPGCRFVRGHRVAVCTGRANAIEIRMGNSGDFVRVKERLPVPLTIYLGGGSDKFIGGGERDTCF